MTAHWTSMAKNRNNCSQIFLKNVHIRISALMCDICAYMHKYLLQARDHSNKKYIVWLNFKTQELVTQKIICHLLQSNNLKSSVWLVDGSLNGKNKKKSGWWQFKWQGRHCGAHLSQGGSFGPRPRGVLIPPIKREMPALQWRYIVSKRKMVKSGWYFSTVCCVKDTKPICNHHGTPLHLIAHWRHKVSLIDIVPGKGKGLLGLFLEAFHPNFSALSSFKNISPVPHHQDCKVDSCTRLNLANHLILDFSLWACTAHLPARGLSGRRDRTRGWRIAAGVLFPHTASKNISHMSQWADCGGTRRGRTLIVRTSQHLDIALSSSPKIC